MEQLRADANVQMVQIREKDTELNIANATIEDLQASIENLQNSNNDHEVNAVNLRQQVEQLCAERSTANDNIEELQSNINVLEVNDALEELRRVKEIPSVKKALLVEEYKKEFPRGTPIVCACEKERFEDVKLLITGYNDVNGSNGNNNNNMKLKEYVSQVGKISWGGYFTPLMIAAYG